MGWFEETRVKKLGWVGIEEIRIKNQEGLVGFEETRIKNQNGLGLKKLGLKTRMGWV